MPKVHTVVSAKPKRRPPRPRNEVTLKITLKAPRLDGREVVDYVTRAIDDFSGMYAADDPRTRIRVVEVQRLRPCVCHIKNDAKCDRFYKDCHDEQPWFTYCG